MTRGGILKGLLNINTVRNSPFLDYVSNSLSAIESVAQDEGPLDSEFSLKELKSLIKSSKNGKAARPDMIINEMFKVQNDNLQLAILHTINVILRSGVYPSDWKLGLISPLYKSKDPDDPNNYRGICMSDCLSKIFCKMLDKRILGYLKEKDLWCINQNGFKEGRRTDDNVFIFHTLFAKYVKG